MSAGPPKVAERILSLVLGSSAEARTILGDLAEDYVDVVRRRGRIPARLWYWKEAMALSVSTLTGRLVDGVRPGGVRPGGVGRGDGVRSAAVGARGSRGSAVPGDPLTMGAVWQDARYALRSIRRDPGFFAFGAVIVGVGVGASTAVFSVVSPLLLQPLPMESPERLVMVEHTDEGGGLSGITSRTSNLRDFRERARSFDGLAGYNAFSGQSSYNLVGSGPPERLSGFQVTDDFLDVLGVSPAVGRDFTPAEGLWDGPDAVMLTHGFWVRRFAGDPAIVGSTVSLNDTPHHVVGVLPPNFDFSSIFAPSQEVDVLLPWPVADETDAWGNTTIMVGRLREGATMAAAQDELESIVAALEEAEPDRWGLGARVSGLQERIARPFRAGMLLLVAAAGLLMLIVCVNLSNMLLARSPRRHREMAIRRTMGATRGRLVRQLLLESGMVALAGAVVGVGVAWAAVRHVAGTSGLDLPLLGAVAVDVRALGFSMVVALLAGLVVGAVPALRIGEGDEAEALNSAAGRGSTSGRGGRRVRELLVVAEVGMACVLLVFGGLVLRSFQSVMDVDPGFDAEGVVAWQLASARDFDTLPEVVAYYDEIVTNVEAVPGVESAGLVDALPMGRNRSWGGRVVGKEYDEGEGESYFPHVVDHRYISTMGIPLKRGRLFTADDDRSAPFVVIVNEAAARTMFPGGEALGQKLDLWFGQPEVVGIVGDVKHRALELEPDNEVYFPMAQVADFGTLDLVVRSTLPPATLAGSVSAAIHTVDAELPTEDYRTLEAVVDRAVSSRRLTLQLLVAFAGSALLLAALGIYAVLSYSVNERTAEIGIRMALGESAGEVRTSLVKRTVGLAAVGIVIGGVVSYVGTSSIRSLLYGVEPTDPLTFGAMVAIVVAVAFLSALVPAIRASRTDSATALRSAG